MFGSPPSPEPAWVGVGRIPPGGLKKSEPKEGRLSACGRWSSAACGTQWASYRRTAPPWWITGWTQWRWSGIPHRNLFTMTVFVQIVLRQKHQESFCVVVIESWKSVSLFRFQRFCSIYISCVCLHLVELRNLLTTRLPGSSITVDSRGSR